MYNIYIYHPNESFGINKIQSAKSGHRTDSSRLSAPERAGVPPLGGRKPTRNARVFTGRGNPRGFFAADWTLGRAALPSRFVWRPKKSRIWRDLVEVRIMHLLSHNFMQHAYIIDIMLFYVLIKGHVWCLQIGIPMSLTISEVLASYILV